MKRLHKNRKKFINRGVYFVTEGEYKGCFVMNMRELDTLDEKVISVYPEGGTMSLSRNDIEDHFEKGHFEYVKTVPKRIYKVCLAQHTGDKK